MNDDEDGIIDNGDTKEIENAAKQLMTTNDIKLMTEYKYDFDNQSAADCNHSLLDFKSITEQCHCIKRAMVIFRFYHQVCLQQVCNVTSILANIICGLFELFLVITPNDNI